MPTGQTISVNLCNAFLTLRIGTSIIEPFSFKSYMSQPYLKIGVYYLVGSCKVDVKLKFFDGFDDSLFRGSCVGCCRT